MSSDQELFDAARNNNAGATKVALDKGANVNAINNEKNTPLHLAAYNCNIEVGKVLLDIKKANVDAKNYLGKTPLSIAKDEMRYDPENEDCINMVEMMKEAKNKMLTSTTKLDIGETIVTDTNNSTTVLGLVASTSIVAGITAAILGNDTQNPISRLTTSNIPMISSSSELNKTDILITQDNNGYIIPSLMFAITGLLVIGLTCLGVKFYNCWNNRNVNSQIDAADMPLQQSCTSRPTV